MGVKVNNTKKTPVKAGKTEIYLAHGVSHRFMGLAFVKDVAYAVNDDVAEHLLALEISGIQKFEQAGIKQKELPRQDIALVLPKANGYIDDDADIKAHLASTDTQVGAGNAQEDEEGIDTGAGTTENGAGTDGAVSV